MLEPPAGEEVLELAGDVPGQGPALGGEPGLESAVMLLDEPIEKGILRSTAHVPGRTGVRTRASAGEPYGRHDRVPAMSCGAGR